VTGQEKVVPVHVPQKDYKIGDFLGLELKMPHLNVPRAVQACSDRSIERAMKDPHKVR